MENNVQDLINDGEIYSDDSDCKNEDNKSTVSSSSSSSLVSVCCNDSRKPDTMAKKKTNSTVTMSTTDCEIRTLPPPRQAKSNTSWKFVNLKIGDDSRTKHEIVDFTVRSNELLTVLLNIQIPVPSGTLAPYKWLMTIVKRFQKQVHSSRVRIRASSNSTQESLLQLNKLEAFTKAAATLLTSEYAAVKGMYALIESTTTLGQRTSGSFYEKNQDWRTPEELEQCALFKKRMLEFSINHFEETYKICVALLT